MRMLVLAAAGVLAVAVLVIAAIVVGSTPLPLSTVIGALSGGPEAATPLGRIVTDLRLPRAILALLTGAGLGVVGCLLQTTTRNDLADPFLFGLSSGAAAGAVFVITVTGDLLGIWTLPAAAFTGGMAASAVVLALNARLGDRGPAQLVLAGLAVSFLFMALTNYLVFAGDQRAAHSVLFWSLGGLGLARWEILPVAAVGLTAVLAFAAINHRRLDAILAGEDTARTLGVDVGRLRTTTFLVCAFGTAAFVSLTGVIGFVGLMVPHMARALAGPLHGGLIMLAALIGAALLLASDIAARTLLAPQELPVGIVTTALGAIFVLALVGRRN
jgi:iron complex transport system permease protein